MLDAEGRSTFDVHDEVRVMSQLAGKIALVTGAGSAEGIGFAAARRLAAGGARVAVAATTSRIHDRVAELRRDCIDGADGADVSGWVADLTDEEQVSALVRGIEARHGGTISICVNNAGMTSLGAGSDASGLLEEMSIADWNDAMARNLSTAFLVTRAVLAGMREQRYGRIVNVASVSGPVVVFDRGSVYAAAKAGMVGMTRALALEVGHLGITVNAVAPGWINTAAALTKEQQAGYASPAGRPGTADEVAACIEFLASPSASYVTGTMLVVDGGNSIVEDLNRRPPT
jgi:3-oxoacyl-[acyl-carrier protein] reductase